MHVEVQAAPADKICKIWVEAHVLISPLPSAWGVLVVYDPFELQQSTASMYLLAQYYVLMFFAENRKFFSHEMFSRFFNSGSPL